MCAPDFIRCVRCSCLKITLSSYGNLLSVINPTGSNHGVVIARALTGIFPVVELGLGLFSLKKVLKSDKGPPAYNASGR